MDANEFFQKANLRKFVSAVSSHQIEKYIQRLEAIKVEHQNAEAEQAASEAEKQAAIEKVNAVMQASGITMDDLNGIKASTKPKKPVAKAYRITLGGEVHEWSGRGRTPKAFQAWFEQGHTKEEAKIK